MDIVLGADEQGHNIKVQAQRLVCLAQLDSEDIRKWHEAGRSFVSRHSVTRKYCCCPLPITPGTQKDNAADARQVR